MISWVNLNVDLVERLQMVGIEENECKNFFYVLLEKGDIRRLEHKLFATSEISGPLINLDAYSRKSKLELVVEPISESWGIQEINLDLTNKIKKINYAQIKIIDSDLQSLKRERKLLSGNNLSIDMNMRSLEFRYKLLDVENLKYVGEWTKDNSRFYEYLKDMRKRI
jgi:hypothetical protein